MGAVAGGLLPSRWADVAEVLPASLPHLAGPPGGIVDLPSDLAWSGRRSFDLADPGQRYLYYMTVLTSAVTRDHYTHWLNADLLRSEWAGPVALKVGALHDRGLPRDLIDVHGAANRFSAAELVALARAALDEEFSLEMLRDQFDRAAMYSDEEFAVYGCTPDQIAEIKTWAQEWATSLGMEIAQAQCWPDETRE